jgi:hypothetical protein
MTSDEIISSYGLRVICEPRPQEIERGMMDAERRLRAEPLRELGHTAIAWLGCVFRRREIQLAHADGATRPAPAA